MALLKNSQLETNDSWKLLADEDPAGEGDIIVSEERWGREREQLLSREGRVGVCLGPDAAPDELAADLPSIDLIAVEFPKFTDGRGYSIARLLRDRLGFKGELRAVGDVLPDQVLFMQRCGFDSMQLADGRDPAVALAALEEIRVRYQPV